MQVIINRQICNCLLQLNLLLCFQRIEELPYLWNSSLNFWLIQQNNNKHICIGILSHSSCYAFILTAYVWLDRNIFQLVDFALDVQAKSIKANNLIEISTLYVRKLDCHKYSKGIDIENYFNYTLHFIWNGTNKASIV